MQGAVVPHTGRGNGFGGLLVPQGGVDVIREAGGCGAVPRAWHPQEGRAEVRARAEDQASPLLHSSFHSCWPMLSLPTSKQQPVPWMR